MIFDWLRGAPTLDDDTLREKLFDAAAAGDDKELARLSKAYEHQVLDGFPGWRQVPEELRSDMGKVQRWAHGLMTVARFFAEELSQPELIVSMQGKSEENPLMQWQQVLEEAQNLMRDGKFLEASEKLAKIVLSVKGLKGSGVDQYLPVTFGMLGECCFQQGQADRAVGPITDAAALCEQHGEKEGMLASYSNLYEVHRYRGDAPAAAAAAEKMAALLDEQERADEATRFRKLAGIIRAGEPLARVIAVVENRPVELDELNPKPNERVQFVFERNRVALRPCVAETQRGEQLASEGKLEEGLEAFRAAAKLDPYDPQPPYLEGLTLMHLQRYHEAVEATDRTEKLAPGWFHCRAQAWMARELAAGRVTHDTFLRLRQLEDGEAPPEEKAALAADTLKTAPNVAAVHLALGNAMLALQKVDEARESFRKGLACSPEPDVASRLRLRLALSGAPDAEGLKLLKDAIDPKGNLVAGAMATVAARTAPV